MILKKVRNANQNGSETEVNTSINLLMICIYKTLLRGQVGSKERTFNHVLGCNGMMYKRTIIYLMIILFGISTWSCRLSRTFQMDHSSTPLSYHEAYWVAQVKPDGAPAKITVINDLHVDTSTHRVTVYAQSRMFGKILSPPQVGPGECVISKTDTFCFHPNAVYLNGAGAELNRSDGSGAWWVKHSWVLGGEGYQNWELKPAKSYGEGHYVDGILLEDGLTMKIGARKDSIFTDFNLRRPIIDVTKRQVRYQVSRYGISNQSGSLEETFNLAWKCKCRKSPLTGGIRTCPRLR